MDAVELGRQRAHCLHAAAVAGGHDPGKPYEFAVAEARRRRIEVEAVPKNDVRLRGARATYDPDALLILHENGDDEFTRAFLVAHEIGHVELGGYARRSLTIDADMMRASESAPVGMDRVVDYSRRARREVQMDLFAREFLLPRAAVRRLHLEEGATATQIAARFNAPFNAVALQLLDALLLPEVDLAEIEAPPDQPLSPDQIAAVRHHGDPYLLEAGPGTGKTRTLVARVEALLDSGVEPSKILVLTFSNKAAGELVERIAFRRPDAAAAMWIGTFHGFGLDIIPQVS